MQQNDNTLQAVMNKSIDGPNPSSTSQCTFQTVNIVLILVQKADNSFLLIQRYGLFPLRRN